VILSKPEKLPGDAILYCGDCLQSLKLLKSNSIDAVVTDPPYHLISIVKRFGGKDAAPAKSGKTGAYKRHSAGFMGKAWDGGDIAFQVELWEEVYRVMKPGAHLLSFGGTRTYHRMACAIEDANFEIRDCVSWNYGSGFPKSQNVSKMIDKKLGVKRNKVKTNRIKNPPNLVGGVNKGDDRPWRQKAIEQGYHEIDSDDAISDDAKEWDGWGTALKPAMELVCLARKPLSEKTISANVLKWGTGVLNIDGCRVGTTKDVPASASKTPNNIYGAGMTSLTGGTNSSGFDPNIGRWPANILLDGSEEVINAFPKLGISAGGRIGNAGGGDVKKGNPGFGDSGSASRFFYNAKSDSDDRFGSKHPTVKPVDLMQYLVRLITPPGGTVLDPFAGTGTTREAAFRERVCSILMEREKEYQNDIRRRMKFAMKNQDDHRHEIAKVTGVLAKEMKQFHDNWLGDDE
jgi:DNA modification methylase